MNRKNGLNNKGFSFIEMLVSVLITGILMLTVGIFISTSRYTYQSVNTSATLQEEAQTANNFISELLMEAKEYGTFEETANVTETDRSYSGDIKVLWIHALNNDGDDTDYHYYFLIFEEKTGKLRYMQAPDTAAVVSAGIGSDIWTISLNSTNKESYIYAALDNKYKLIAENVKSIEVPDPVEQGGAVLINVELEFSYFDTDFKSNINTLSRNIRLR